MVQNRRIGKMIGPIGSKTTQKKNFFGMPQIKKSKNTNVLQSLKEAVFKISCDSDDRGELRY
jgi:hypothetical protein